MSGVECAAGPKVSTDQSGPITQITVAGELDIGSISDVAEAVNRGLADRPEKLLIDLQHVGFLDSQALGLLVGTARRAMQQGAQLIVRPPEGSARRTFEIAGILAQDGSVGRDWLSDA
jgi:anti-anti-sigma factor